MQTMHRNGTLADSKDFPTCEKNTVNSDGDQRAGDDKAHVAAAEIKRKLKAAIRMIKTTAWRKLCS